MSSRPIAIVGPTGTGKSDLAVEVAVRLGGEVVNADAMQQYRGMDIGTAKLRSVERRGVAHHQLDVLDVTATATVARYQQAAVADVEAIAARGAVPIIVGGSMMYVQSLLDDWDFPATDPATRARWEHRLADIGVAALHAELARADPAAAAAILDTDGRRIVRALEVIEITGEPFVATLPEPTSVHPTVRLGLEIPREALDARIADRVDAMWAAGFVSEVARLRDRGLGQCRTASRALGYQQILDFLDGRISEEEARSQTIDATRRFARRQQRWFRRDGRIEWIGYDDEAALGRSLDLVRRGPVTDT